MWLPTVDHIMRPTPGTIINPKMQQWLIIEYLNFYGLSLESVASGLILTSIKVLI